MLKNMICSIYLFSLLIISISGVSQEDKEWLFVQFKHADCEYSFNFLPVGILWCLDFQFQILSLFIISLLFVFLYLAILVHCVSTVIVIVFF